MPRDGKTHDKEMAKHDVKYKQVWKCKVCKQTRSLPKDAWNAWSKAQQDSFTDELDRQHQVHPEE
jgi:hypothetical protein